MAKRNPTKSQAEKKTPAKPKTQAKRTGNRKTRTRTKKESTRNQAVKKQVAKSAEDRTLVKVEKEKQTPKAVNRRKDWRDNHALVLDTFLRLMKTYKRKPTLDELANQTGLSVQAVSRHLKTDEFTDTKEDLRILTSNVLLSIYSAAMQGKTQSQRLWLEVVEGWKPTTGIDLNLNVKTEAVIVLPTNNREDKTIEVQGWSEADWDDLDNEAKDNAKK